MAALSKTKLTNEPASKAPLQRSLRIVAENLAALVRPFGWTVNESKLAEWSDTLLKTVELWLAADADDSSWIAPDWMLQAVLIPAEQRRAFKNDTDARALASVILETHWDFQLLTSGRMDSVKLLQSRDTANGAGTPFGTVFAEAEPIAIWFGRKHKMQPALAGATAETALRQLFAPATREETPDATREESPPAASVSGPKSKSGARKCGTVKLVARKAKPETAETVIVDPITGNSMQTIDIDLIVPDTNNREMSDGDQSIKDLASNIRQLGLLQPITVRPIRDTTPQRYMITAGERRWRACRLAGFETIPAIIRETAGHATAVTRLSENVLRENLTPSQLASEYKRLLDSGMTQKQVGEMFAEVSQGQISNTLRLLELPPSILQQVDAGTIKPTLIRSAIPYCDIPAVVKNIETLIESGDEITTVDIDRSVNDGIVAASRNMEYESDWHSYSKPDPKRRHFETLSKSDEKNLKVQTCKKLAEWQGQTRAFNVELFDQLNAEPLAERQRLHAAWKKKNTAAKPGAKAKAKGKDTKEIVYFENGHRVRMTIEGDMMEALANAIEACTDKVASYRIAITLIAFNNCDSFGNVLVGQQLYGMTHIPKLIEAIPTTVAEIQTKIKSAAVQMLREDCVELNVAECQQLAAVIGADLIRDWTPSEDVRQSLTSDGQLALAESKPGTIPEFLQPLFQ